MWYHNTDITSFFFSQSIQSVTFVVSAFWVYFSSQTLTQISFSSLFCWNRSFFFSGSLTRNHFTLIRLFFLSFKIFFLPFFHEHFVACDTVWHRKRNTKRNIWTMIRVKEGEREREDFSHPHYRMSSMVNIPLSWCINQITFIKSLFTYKFWNKVA